MKKVLVLGAGLVAGPLVNYLLDQPGVSVTNASRTVSKAEANIGDHENGTAIQLLTEDTEKMEALISEHDVTVSLLPYIYHVKVAKLCIKHHKNMVTTSYVSDAMRALDEDAKAAGIVILNELGVDPGIDHMSAMRIIDAVHDDGGKITHFKSYCGGLPAPEANDNPFGYKFSWSPRGVVLAARNAAKYKMDGEVVDIPGERLFYTNWPVTVEEVGELEAYPNRNALPYIDLYGIPEAETMYRGTLRYPGWSALLQKLVALDFLDEAENAALDGASYREMMATLVDAPTDGSADEVKQQVADFLDVPTDDPTIEKMAWLGLFSDETVTATDPLDILANRLLEKLEYKPGERDMIVMRHEFVATYPDADRPDEQITMTLVDYGIPNGATSMSRTVGLPAAIATKMVVNGEVDLTGVHIPVLPELYNPILDELERLGIECVEETETVEE